MRDRERATSSTLRSDPQQGRNRPWAVKGNFSDRDVGRHGRPHPERTRQLLVAIRIRLAAVCVRPLGQRPKRRRTKIAAAAEGIEIRASIEPTEPSPRQIPPQRAGHDEHPSPFSYGRTVSSLPTGASPAEAEDHFGPSLSAGQLDPDDDDDLVVGAPDEHYGTDGVCSREAILGRCSRVANLASRRRIASTSIGRHPAVRSRGLR